MYYLGLVIAYFWGIGQNLPYDQFYFAGIGPGDGLFIGYLAYAFAFRPARMQMFDIMVRSRHFVYLIFFFVALTLLSSLTNAYVWGVNGKDVIEAMRPLYYLLLVVFVTLWTEKYGLKHIVIAFLLGITTSAVVAYLNPSNANVMGFPVLWNSNVIGNMLAMGILLASLLILDGKFISAGLFVAVFAVFSVFTYSKGAWIMSILAVAACLVAAFGVRPNRQSVFLGKAVFALVFAGIVMLGMQYSEVIYELLFFKLHTTQIGDTAAEGSTIAARFGFVLASFQLAMDNPLLGVGISNYERAYDSLRTSLGGYYWETDNPHSAWLYVAACVGVPGLIVFSMIVIYSLKKLANKSPLRRASKTLYLTCISMVLFISGAVALQLVTQHFFWFFVGLVSAERRARCPSEASEAIAASRYFASHT